MWTMAALGRAATRHPLHLFDGNTFVPHRGTLLYSDALAGMALPFGLLRAVGVGPVPALNLVHLLLGLLSLEGTYLLCRHHRVRPGVAMAAAIGFAFSTFTLSHHGHVNLQAVGLLPLGVLLLLRALDRPSPGRGAAFGAFAAGVYLTVGYFALMLAVASGVLVVARLVRPIHRPAFDRRLVACGLGAVLAVGAIGGPAVALFLRTRAGEGFERSAVEVDQGRLDPGEDLLEGAEGSVPFGLLDRTADDDPEHGLALDVVAVVGVVAGVGATALAWRRRPSTDVGLAGYALVGVAGYLLALGPAPGRAGTVFRTAAAVVPGFDTVRVPARLALLVLFAVVVGGAIGWERVLVALDGRGRAAVARVLPVVLVVVALAQATSDLPRWRYDDRPSSLAVYRALADRPAGAVVALPMRDVLTTSGTLIEATRMVYSTTDWHPRVNGYSSFVPSDYEPRRRVLDTFPSAESLALLDRLGVRYVLLEEGKRSTLPMYSGDQLAAVLAALPPQAKATRYGEARLVELRSSRASWSGG